MNIQKTVEKLVNQDLEGKNTLARGILNLSQYARIIQKEVESETKKDVSVQSIVVALSRLEKRVKVHSHLPEILVKQLVVKSPIVQIIFSKNKKTTDALVEAIKKTEKLEDAFFSFSTSSRDIAIIISEDLEEEIVKGFFEKPKIIKRNLSAVSIRFDEGLVKESNIGLGLLHKISLRDIVLDAAITTYNEFTLVFEAHFLHDVIEVLNPQKNEG